LEEETMKRIALTLALILAILATIGGPSVRAQNASASYIVQIRAGTCDAPGDGLAQLEDVVFSSSPTVGAAEAVLAASSYSVAPIALSALTGSSTAVFVLDSASHAAVACGEVGGVPGSDGALSIGLRPMSDSSLSGIAYLASNGANPAETGISTFLASTGAASAGGDATATTMDPADYSSMVNSQITILVGSLQRIDTLFADAHAGDTAWTGQVRAELFLWQLLYRVAQEANAPSDFADFDAQYLDALSLLDSAAGDISKGLSTNDSSLLSTASGKIRDAVAMLRGLDALGDDGTPVAGTPVP
jgi:hypothetical protein